jgi:hypothetical protein
VALSVVAVTSARVIVRAAGTPPGSTTATAPAPSIFPATTTGCSTRSRSGLMTYDTGGNLIQVELADDPELAARHCHWRDVALHHAMPLADYLHRQRGHRPEARSLPLRTEPRTDCRSRGYLAGCAASAVSSNVRPLGERDPPMWLPALEPEPEFWRRARCGRSCR